MMNNAGSRRKMFRGKCQNKLTKITPLLGFIFVADDKFKMIGQS